MPRSNEAIPLEGRITVGEIWKKCGVTINPETGMPNIQRPYVAANPEPGREKNALRGYNRALVMFVSFLSRNVSW